MADYVLSCCSPADISGEHMKKRGISCVYSHFTLGGKEYLDDLGATVPYDEFYKRMADGEETLTAQVNSAEFCDYFREILKTGKDIVHVVLSSGLSGTINSAKIASEMMKDEFPERTVYVIDSLAASSGLGLFMETLADLRDSGMGAEELVNWAEEHKLNLHHWFFSTDLTYYVRGGRISKAAGWFGTALKICPLMNMDNLGRLVPRIKVRGKNKVIAEIVKKMEECAEDGNDYSGKCYISQSDMEAAEAVKKLVEEKFPKLNGEVLINNIGTTVGSHSGPGTVALFFWGKKRID